MSQIATTTTAAEAPAQLVSPCLWGLSARQLHDAFWHARGVQPVRQGEHVGLQSAAELFLLIQPDQLIWFDIAAVSERLLWRNALVTRLRLTDADDNFYAERVALDDDGCVVRIERQYRPHMHRSYRAVLTPSRRIASLWMAESDRRKAWDRVRRSVSRARLDYWRGEGTVFDDNDADQQRSFLDQLIERWPCPAQSINGIVESENGVWRRAGDVLPAHAARIGPLWLGAGAHSLDEKCIVGPAWFDDAAIRLASTASPVTVRPIREVELAQTLHTAPPAAGRPAYRAAKRALDVCMSAGALALLAPAMVVIALMIKLEDGHSIFFGQRRQGKGGVVFRCWKFRTMCPNAEQIARELEAYNSCDGPQIFIEEDPRVTRFGKILRRAHLDELPQFWNVIRGQMSIVGPRPSPDDENQFCPAWRDERLSVRPGITGLWQMLRTREPGEDFQEWIKYDIEYVRNATMWLDLKIIIGTAWTIAVGRSDHEDE